MKGFKLQMNGECISGAIDNGITSILVSNKEGKYRVVFSSMDNTGMFSYTWYSSGMEIGDHLSISFEDIIHVSEVKETRDYNITLEESQKRDLETYYKLKAELIKEGIISE